MTTDKNLCEFDILLPDSRTVRVNIEPTRTTEEIARTVARKAGLKVGPNQRPQLCLDGTGEPLTGTASDVASASISGHRVGVRVIGVYSEPVPTPPQAHASGAEVQGDGSGGGQIPMIRRPNGRKRKTRLWVALLSLICVGLVGYGISRLLLSTGPPANSSHKPVRQSSSGRIKTDPVLLLHQRHPKSGSFGLWNAADRAFQPIDLPIQFDKADFGRGRAAISPDKKWLAFVARPQDARFDQLFLLERGTGNATLGARYLNKDSKLSWSPSSQALATNQYAFSDTEEEILRQPGDLNHRWVGVSPYSSSRLQLAIVTIPPNTKVTRTGCRLGDDMCSIAWSPNGEVIAHMEYIAPVDTRPSRFKQSQRIWAYTITKRESTRLGEAFSHKDYLFWLPKGEGLLFRGSRKQAGQDRLWLLRSSLTGKVTPMGPAPYSYRGFYGLLDHGTRIAWLMEAGNIGLSDTRGRILRKAHLIDATTEESRALQSSPNGKFIAITTRQNTTGTDRTRIYVVDGENIRPIDTISGFSAMGWSN